MSFFTVRNIKSSRKTCRCYWCGECIEKGHPKVTTANICEGDFFYTKFHPECYSALERWQAKYRGEEYWPDDGEMTRGSIEPKYSVEQPA